MLLFVAALGAYATARAQTGSQEGTVYGGGQIGRSFSDRHHFVRIRVPRARREVRFFASFLTACSGSSEQHVANGAQTVRLASGGRFSGGGEHRDAGPGGSQEGTWSFSGRFRGRGVATGTARLRMTVRKNDGGALQCDSGVVRWTVRDPLRAPGTGALGRGRAYFGHSERRVAGARPAPLLLRVSRDARRVAVLAYFQYVRCQGRGVQFVTHRVGGIRITRRGSFQAATSFSDVVGEETERVSLNVVGRFGRRRVSGRLRVRVRIVRAGAQVDDCRSGRLAWTTER